MPGTWKVEKTHARVTLADRWSVNKGTSGGSMGSLAGDSAALSRKSRESTPMSLICYHGSRKRQEVSIFIVYYLVNKLRVYQ